MAMVEYLMSFVQCLCLLGYLYGAWLVITHKADAGPLRGRDLLTPISDRPADESAGRRYLACD
jgi:hypothetical protein